MKTKTKYDIEALIDGELDQVEERHVRAYIEEDVDLKHFYEEQLEQKQLLKRWWSSIRVRTY